MKIITGNELNDYSKKDNLSFEFDSFWINHNRNGLYMLACKINPKLLKFPHTGNFWINKGNKDSLTLEKRNLHNS